MSDVKVTPRGARRRSETDERIVTSVLAIIRESGLRGVTVEAVTSRSGVAKTTVYRRYNDRFELLAGVLEQLSPIPEYRKIGSSRAGLVALLADIQAVFEERVGLRAVGQLLASDEDLTRGWRDRVVSPRLAAMRQFFADGVRDGTFEPELDYDVVVELVTGGMVVCDAMRGDVPDDWAETVVSILWPMIHRTRPASDGR